jgi:aconitase A
MAYLYYKEKDKNEKLSETISALVEDHEIEKKKSRQARALEKRYLQRRIRQIETELSNSRRLSQETEQGHLAIEDALCRQIQHTHGIIEMLLDPMVQNDLTIDRQKARRLFVV